MTIETTLPVMTVSEVCDSCDNCNFPNYVANDAHFRRGAECAEGMEYITIAVNNVWGGRSKCGGSVSSYEKIGYHAGSVDFIKGALSTGCPVYVYRSGRDGCAKYRVVAD